MCATTSLRPDSRAARGQSSVRPVLTSPRLLIHSSADRQSRHLVEWIRASGDRPHESPRGPRGCCLRRSSIADVSHALSCVGVAFALSRRHNASTKGLASHAERHSRRSCSGNRVKCDLIAFHSSPSFSPSLAPSCLQSPRLCLTRRAAAPGWMVTRGFEYQRWLSVEGKQSASSPPLFLNSIFALLFLLFSLSFSLSASD